jgi:hypothetical protein
MFLKMDTALIKQHIQVGSFRTCAVFVGIPCHHLHPCSMPLSLTEEVAVEKVKVLCDGTSQAF